MPEIKDLTTWEKHMTKLFVDFSKTETPAWARIGKSTVLDIAMNPEMETFDFIDSETPVEFLKNYKPTLAQEHYLAAGEPAFDELFTMYHARPVGIAAIRPCIIVYPKTLTGETTSFIAQKADATISFTNYNAVDKKLTFNIGLSGIVNGKATFADGKPTFTADVTP